MAHLQIKDVPGELHDELRRRADQRGLTQRDYVLALIRKDQASPSWEDWRLAHRHRRQIDLGRPAAEVVHAERDERDVRLDARP